MDVRIVSDLPVIDQSAFPPLPKIRNNSVLMCFDTEWRNAEKEAVAAIIITHAVRQGSWIPVSAINFGDILTSHPTAAMFPQNVVNAMWKLIELKVIEIVSYRDVQYLIPTPEMARIALGNPNKLRIV